MTELNTIQSKIHEIRGRRVMLDFDLARLYEIETRTLKQAVKRNIERFPEDFMFELSKHEWSEVITNCDNLPETIKYSPATPYAFTEQGVSMLSAVLRSPIAIQISILIMRAFVAMRQLLMSSVEIRQLALENKEIRAKLELLERNDEDMLGDMNDLSEDLRHDIEDLYAAIGALSVQPPPPPRTRIGFEID